MNGVPGNRSVWRVYESESSVHEYVLSLCGNHADSSRCTATGASGKTDHGCCHPGSHCGRHKSGARLERIKPPGTGSSPNPTVPCCCRSRVKRTRLADWTIMEKSRST